MVKRLQNTHTLKIRYLIWLVALLVATGTLVDTTITVAAASSEDLSPEQYHNSILVAATANAEYLAAEQACRIMPLGDSITTGSKSTNTVGYRQSLYLSLTGEGYNVDFVGRNSHGSGATPSFDTDHEGHSGWTADDMVGSVLNWLTANPADIVLLHIGTNDMDVGEPDTISEDVDQVADILDEIDLHSPDTAVILARIINRKPYSADTTQFNNELALMAQQRISDGDKLLVVDMENALTYPDDMADEEHPNDTGYVKMADVWFNVLDNLLPGCALPEVTLTVDEIGGGAVTRDPDSSSYSYGQVITLTATADPGWTFAGWSGDLSGVDNPTTLTLTGAHVVTATFTQNQYTLSLNTAGSGTVTRNPAQPSYVYGQVVTLTATANSAWTFAGWSGDLSGTTNPATLTITGNHVATATFKQSTYYTFLPMALNSP